MKSKIKRMFAAAKKATALELFVYDQIGADWYGGGITPQSVTDAIKQAGEFDSITVHINSPGGSSFDGVAIHNILRQQGVPVNVVVEGLAASAAFTIAMAGDTIGVCDAAMLMLHNAWSFEAGDADALRKMADLLDKVSGTMRDMYAKRSGLSADDVAALMDAETWLTAEEAVAKGFATENISTTPEKDKEAAALAAQFNLKKFCGNVPEKLKADIGCQCPCGECMDGDCDECSHEDCDCIGCDCPQEADAKASTTEVALTPETPINAVSVDASDIDSAIRSRRLRLLELGGDHCT